LVQAKQESVGLTMSVPADRRTLLRRVSFDLVGLPPSVQEVVLFEQDARPDAYERQVDRLLASPRHGERWARHWLDVVRFAQTDGYERDSEKPESWRYRDYVIDSFNVDKPYDQFLREQLAGDELDRVTDETLVATGFGRLGVWDDEPDDKVNAEFEHYDDLVSTFGQSMMGLTVGCARCHDHKFDPIPQRDYYGLVSFFRGVRQNERFDAAKKDFPNLVTLSTGERALAMREAGREPAPTHVLIRGDGHTPGAAVEPHFLEVLSLSREAARASIATPSAEATSSGRRRTLAEWVTRGDHPLTARVMVNRLWQHHFGKGIVPTPNDFGKTGLPPTQPELLDWLATVLVEECGWQLKPIHRWIVESAVYRQASAAPLAEGNRVDPGNDFLWRQSLRRLDAETMRDAVLSANGQLSLNMGGRGFFPPLPKEVLATQSIPGNGWGQSPPDQLGRRSIYAFVKRTLRVPMLEAFDAATPDQSIAARSVTTIAPQALVWLNSSFMEEESLAMADRLLAMEGEDEDRLRMLFESTLQRLPTTEERTRAVAFLASAEADWQNLRPEPTTESVVERWNRFGGQWTEREDGGIEVSPDDGAKALWPTGLIARGTIEAEIMLRGEPGNAGLIFRVLRPYEGVNALVGYYVGLSADQVMLGKHVDGYQLLQAVDRKTSIQEWHSVRVVLEEGRIQVYVDGGENPVIDLEENSLADPGQVGFRTYQMRAGFRHLRVRSEQGEWAGATSRSALVTPRAREAEIRRRAWGDLARIVFNTNEFVYVD
jgi:hypothetical protein